jgi:predicted HicB family RNase H-like nuclease
MRKAKVGRPKLPKGEAKGVVLQSRVQPAEKAAYQRAAKSQDVDLSTWIRQTLNAALNGRHVV